MVPELPLPPQPAIAASTIAAVPLMMPLTGFFTPGPPLSRLRKSDFDALKLNQS
jgi:hypothetical protein